MKRKKREGSWRAAASPDQTSCVGHRPRSPPHPISLRLNRCSVPSCSGQFMVTTSQRRTRSARSAYCTSRDGMGGAHAALARPPAVQAQAARQAGRAAGLARCARWGPGGHAHRGAQDSWQTPLGPKRCRGSAAVAQQGKVLPNGRQFRRQRCTHVVAAPCPVQACRHVPSAGPGTRRAPMPPLAPPQRPAQPPARCSAWHSRSRAADRS